MNLEVGESERDICEMERDIAIQRREALQAGNVILSRFPQGAPTLADARRQVRELRLVLMRLEMLEAPSREGSTAG